jgi:hypothetical protein
VECYKYDENLYKRYDKDGLYKNNLLDYEKNSKTKDYVKSLLTFDEISTKAFVNIICRKYLTQPSRKFLIYSVYTRHLKQIEEMLEAFFKENNVKCNIAIESYISSDIRNANFFLITATPLSPKYFTYGENKNRHFLSQFQFDTFCLAVHSSSKISSNCFPILAYSKPTSNVKLFLMMYEPLLYRIEKFNFDEWVSCENNDNPSLKIKCLNL